MFFMNDLEWIMRSDSWTSDKNRELKSSNLIGPFLHTLNSSLRAGKIFKPGRRIAMIDFQKKKRNFSMMNLRIFHHVVDHSFNEWWPLQNRPIFSSHVTFKYHVIDEWYFKNIPKSRPKNFRLFNWPKF